MPDHSHATTAIREILDRLYHQGTAHRSSRAADYDQVSRLGKSLRVSRMGDVLSDACSMPCGRAGTTTCPPRSATSRSPSPVRLDTTFRRSEPGHPRSPHGPSSGRSRRSRSRSYTATSCSSSTGRSYGKTPQSRPGRLPFPKQRFSACWPRTGSWTRTGSCSPCSPRGSRPGSQWISAEDFVC